MKSVGLCTHFSQTDEWAFDYALELVQLRQWQLTICHWLRSPYLVRRDLVYRDLFDSEEVVQITPRLLNKFEFQLRQCYEPKLGDFTNVAFKLCEGLYQVELVRCLRGHLLDIVVIGYQPPPESPSTREQPLEVFAAEMKYPLVIVGIEGPGSFLINPSAYEIVEQLALPEDSWSVLVPVASPL